MDLMSKGASRGPFKFKSHMAKATRPKTRGCTPQILRGWKRDAQSKRGKGMGPPCPELPPHQRREDQTTNRDRTLPPVQFRNPEKKRKKEGLAEEGKTPRWTSKKVSSDRGAQIVGQTRAHRGPGHRGESGSRTLHWTLILQRGC